MPPPNPATIDEALSFLIEETQTTDNGTVDPSKSLPDRPLSASGRKRPASSLARELLALTGDEGVQDIPDVDRKKRRVAATMSELKLQQGE